MSTPPGDLRPMLATASDALPAGADWAYEMKWDGVRAIAVVEDRRVRLASRNGNDVTVAYPEIQALGRGARPARRGARRRDRRGRRRRPRRASSGCRPRMHLPVPAAIREIAQQVPVAYMVFDLLWLDGHLVTDAGVPRAPRPARATSRCAARRGRRRPRATTAGRRSRSAEQLGFEGVVAKRLDSRLRARSPLDRVAQGEAPPRAGVRRRRAGSKAKARAAAASARC